MSNYGLGIQRKQASISVLNFIDIILIHLSKLYQVTANANIRFPPAAASHSTRGVFYREVAAGVAMHLSLKLVPTMLAC